MHISHILIRNYRGIKHAEIFLGPRLNVLVGRNGSGKSTIISALRLLLDASYGRQARMLDESDLHGNEKFTQPANVIIGARLSGFGDSPLDRRLRFEFGVADETSKWFLYRFRPKEPVRTDLSNNVRDRMSLNRADYAVERLLGVDEDLSTLEWDDDIAGVPDLSDSDLENITVAEIPALRDVVDAMRRERTSPLAGLIDTFTVAKPEQDAVEAAYVAAQKIVESVGAFSDLAKAVELTYMSLASEINTSMRVGLTKPTFSSIVRDLVMLLTDDLVSDLELRRNGLGLNNLLYIAMLLETFARKQAEQETPLVLIEEPEAHLHPQAQLGLMGALQARSFQTIVTTHSPYIAMAGGLRAIINLDRDDDSRGVNIAQSGHFSEDEIADLNRFLATDRGMILFATAIILVEGPSEQTLVPVAAELLGYDLSRLGIQVCAVNGTHFATYEKFLGARGLNRPYVIIRDGDAQNGPDGSLLELFDDGTNVSAVAGEFATFTTLEYALLQIGTLPAVLDVVASFGMPKTVELFEAALKTKPVLVTGKQQKALFKVANRVGKARFAQAIGQQMRERKLPAPAYIREAIEAIIKARGAAATRVTP